ncbi:MAG: hypothetical protein IJ375_04745 [Oscillospiraceae bacterium]|nr:hypothetical protein [Oscillospiraceae bacterium]
MFKRKLIIGIIAGLNLLIGCLCFLPAAREIDQSFLCTVSLDNNSDTLQTATVRFRGTYYDYLFLTDRFDGYITESGIDETQARISWNQMETLTSKVSINSEHPAFVDERTHWSSNSFQIKEKRYLLADEDLKSFQLYYYIPISDGDWTLNFILTYPQCF